MSNELFVDGICEIDDANVRSYFAKFGSRITKYESHRQRATNSCCFALILFESQHTVNAILRRRPHLINNYAVFVKRLLPPDTCSYIERLLPVSTIFVLTKLDKTFDYENLKKFFRSFGAMKNFKYDSLHNRIVIEYGDYDSVDRIFLCKEDLPENIEIHKNVLPHAQNTITYHGVCHRKEQSKVTEDEQMKHRNNENNIQVDDHYEDLLQKTIENLIKCKAQLKAKESEYTVLHMEYVEIKEKADHLYQLVHKQDIPSQSCQSCRKHVSTISKLRETLNKLNKEYHLIKQQYEHLLSTKEKSLVTATSKYDISVRPRRPLFSTRLNNNQNFKNEVPEKCLCQSNRSMVDSYDIAYAWPRSSFETDKHK